MAFIEAKNRVNEAGVVKTPIEARPQEKKFSPEVLPVYKKRAEIEEEIYKNPTIIVSAETGSGKSTQIPLMIRNILKDGEKVAVTQPRRIACRNLAKFVAAQDGCELGQEIGYQTRFEKEISDKTNINFMTDGLLLRKMVDDPYLDEYSAVMVDEAHERSTNIDLTLGLLKQVQEKRREKGRELKIVITSATMETDKFSKFFKDEFNHDARVFEIEGRQYPVSVHYASETPSDMSSAISGKIGEILQKSEDGNILVFLSGKKEIKEAMQAIQENPAINDEEILPLHSEMSSEDQDRIFVDNGKRKIICSTNVAETSLTVPGVKYVVDSGQIKEIQFDPANGIEALVTARHAKSGCNQRAGRAGRVAPGECYRLYSERDFRSRPDFQTPEILRSSLAEVVLNMKALGIDDVRNFPFINQPDVDNFDKAIDTLKFLGGLDEGEGITETGELMAELPMEPRLSKMIIEAKKNRCVRDVTTIAAFLGGKDVFLRPEGDEEEADRAHDSLKVRGSDLLTLLNVWKQFELERKKGTSEEWAKRKYLNENVLQEVDHIRTQLFDILRDHDYEISEGKEPHLIAKSVALGLVENLMRKVPGNGKNVRFTYKPVFLNVEPAPKLHPSSVLKDEAALPEYIVASEIFQTTRPDGNMITYATVCEGVEFKWVEDRLSLANRTGRKKDKRRLEREEKGRERRQRRDERRSRERSKSKRFHREEEVPVYNSRTGGILYERGRKSPVMI